MIFPFLLLVRRQQIVKGARGRSWGSRLASVFRRCCRARLRDETEEELGRSVGLPGLAGAVWLFFSAAVKAQLFHGILLPTCYPSQMAGLEGLCRTELRSPGRSLFFSVSLSWRFSEIRNCCTASWPEEAGKDAS